MADYLFLILGAVFIAIGALLGYLIRQNIAKFQIGSLEQNIQKKLNEAKTEAQNIILDAKRKAIEISKEPEKRLEKLRWQLERKQGYLDQKMREIRKRENQLKREKEEIIKTEERVRKILKRKEEELEKIAGISREKAKEELLKEIERGYQKEFLEKISKLEKEGEERFKTKAKEILAFAIQKTATPLIPEIGLISVPLPDDEIKGRIIGKEGRNIKAFENATGVELIVDETPNVVFLSSFDLLRREIAKIAMEKLIKDTRIQPTRIEETVKKIEEEMPQIIEQIGEKTALELEIFDLEPRLHQLLGKLRFRTSYGQNVLTHSIEVAYLASALAEEIKADVKIAKKAGLLHDIGKSIDIQVEGSHIEIGIKILEKFKIEEEVIKAIKSHHEDYPYESIEAVIIQTADAISASRPGARKDTVENYLKRIEELEKIAKTFPAVEKAYAVEAGRELRVLVKSEEIDDFGAKKLAKEIANAVETETRYPGEIKVTVIRETRIIDYAR